jgi:hypothetical protein
MSSVALAAMFMVSSRLVLGWSAIGAGMRRLAARPPAYAIQITTDGRSALKGRRAAG